MNRVYLQVVLYLAKKKESKIIDYSNFTYVEKVKLLEFYKQRYEELQNQSHEEESSANDEALLESKIENNDEDFTVPDLCETVDSSDDSEDSKIEEEYNEIEMVIEETNNTNSLSNSSVTNDTNNSKDSAFEYSSFTPYKPTYDNLNLNSNIFSMDLDTGMKMEVAKVGDKVEKYQREKKNTNYKSTKDGNYKVSDVYSSSKEKYELPIIKVIVVAFALLALAISVAQFVDNYNNMKLTSYIVDFGYALLSLLILVSVLTKSDIVGTFKGIALFVAVGFDFIFVGVSQYQDNLYKVLNPSKDNEEVFAILILLSVLFKYIYLLMCGVKTIIKKNIFKISVVFAVLAVALNIIVFFIQYSNDAIDTTFDMLPATVNIILILIALLAFEFKEKNN